MTYLIREGRVRHLHANDYNLQVVRVSFLAMSCLAVCAHKFLMEDTLILTHATGLKQCASFSSISRNKLLLFRSALIMTTSPDSAGC